MTEENKNVESAEEVQKSQQKQDNEALSKRLPTSARQVLASLDAIEKSYTTGHENNPADMVDGASLRVEALDRRVYDLTWGNEDFTIFAEVPRAQATSTVQTYTVLQRHGQTGHSRFVHEQEIGTVNDPHHTREQVKLKFVSDTKNVSIAAELVGNIQNPRVALEEDAMKVAAKTIEWGIFYGDADMSADTQPESGTQFDGMAKIIGKEAPHNVVDLRGKTLEESDLNNASTLVKKGYGRATHAFMPISVLADFTNSLYDRQRALMPMPNGGTATGLSVNQFLSSGGTIDLMGSTIMDNDDILDTNIKQTQNSPRPPVSVTATVNTGDNGEFRDNLPNNKTELKDHEYRVVVFSNDGQSLPSGAETATVANATDSVTLEIELDFIGTATPEFVRIYRKGIKTGHSFLIGQVAVSEIQDGVITFTDRNGKIPETADVFIGEMSPDVIQLYELLPMLRLPMARVNASTTFSVLWYGGLALRAPFRWVHLKNVDSVPAFSREALMEQ